MADDIRHLVGAASSPLAMAQRLRGSARRRASPARLRIALDPEHPTPLYHQIAQAIRWKIGTGALNPGDALPPLRDAAAAWGVNYHTARQAYAELTASGYVSCRPGLGTCVAGSAGSSARRADRAAFDRFLHAIREAARARFGLDARELAARLVAGGPAGRTRVVVVECNAHQSSDLASQLEARWPVHAVPWELGRRGAPPAGPIVGTYFHHNEMPRRWPERVPDMHFVTLQLDPAAVRTIVERVNRFGAKSLVVCERDQGTGRELAADLARALGFPFPIAVTVRRPAGLLRRPLGDRLIVVAPRVWDTLPEAAREHVRVIELRHIIDSEDLERLGDVLRFPPDEDASSFSGRRP